MQVAVAVATVAVATVAVATVAVATVAVTTVAVATVAVATVAVATVAVATVFVATAATAWPSWLLSHNPNTSQQLTNARTHECRNSNFEYTYNDATSLNPCSRVGLWAVVKQGHLQWTGSFLLGQGRNG